MRPAISWMDDKRRNARAFLDHSNVRRQILLDDLEGTAHRAYGLLPNMTWIVGRGGLIHYKSSWTSAMDVANALEGVLDFQANPCEESMGPVLQRAQRMEHARSGAFPGGVDARRAAGGRRLPRHA